MSASTVTPPFNLESCQTTNHGENSIDVFENYVLQTLLSHNPWWLKEAPPWCSDIRLSNENMATQAKQWKNSVVTESYLAELQRRESIINPMNISVNDSFGRHLIATRDIAPGEMLLLEPPLVLGNRPQSPPYCSKCFKRTEDFTCPSCGFYFCGSECLTEDHREECSILQNFGFAVAEREKMKEEEILWERLTSMPHDQQEQARALLQQVHTSSALQRQYDVLQQYGLVPIIRTLIALNKSELTRNIILNLQSNVDETSQRYRINHKRLVEVLVNKLKIQADPAFLHRICSVWDTNGFEVSLAWGTRVHGLYPFASLMTHDCRANTQQWFTNDGNFVLRAVNHIPKGSLITSCYTDPQWATMIRQDHLRITKQFTCTCARCSDPTEIGTYLGSPLCPNCSGLLVPVVPLDPTTQWVCNKGCSHTSTAKEIARIGASIGTEIKGINPNNTQEIDTVADELQKRLHSGHHVLLQLHVSNLKNITTKDLSELRDDELKKMVHMAELVMEIVRRLEAPMTRFTVRMAREEIRLRLEIMKRSKNQGQHIRTKLQAMAPRLRECELVSGWDARMPSMAPVLQDYHILLNS
ncbi:hypothetical protein SK128_026282 [Halocaridina rubra]|uniref:SET domain-containing protein n=1 Tax=Halocaridina rubra TaxID=373956 RepID=A0AAN8ZXI8_HALRR